MKNINLTISSLNAVKRIQNVQKIYIITEEGRICITPGHSNVVAKILEGELFLVFEDRVENLYLSDGILSFLNNNCEIITRI
ncbi:hypothetical protein [Candidatus Gromoviella agglomerans]|uniref:hypothetical protein n=1 Tax=Candidatus Gromoviella agglomerans TaxID=2806609 RepID=UPI001E43FDA8|nr:hypothetical protein [Candidatus Gromoviella agglomerans]UFX98180.1 ATP synthase epsilon chain [Candidatus Gromoviella agglomerans]